VEGVSQDFEDFLSRCEKKVGREGDVREFLLNVWFKFFFWRKSAKKEQLKEGLEGQPS